jgi:RNA polymerase sigma-70 factor (ECF subfamily)
LDVSTPTWFEPLVERHERRAFQFAVMLTQHRPTAEEVLQEAFARVWASPNTPRQDVEFRRWLYRVIANLARDYQRRRRLESTLRLWAPPPLDPVEQVVRRAEDRDLALALRTLPLKEREAIYLHYFENEPFAEIARLQRSREGTVRVMVHRALAKLRRQLGPSGPVKEVPN